MAADAHIHPLHTAPLKIRRALLSVSDKSGIVELATALSAHGVELISTGGTKKSLLDAGIPVKDVSDVTGFPEVMDGRVKTLHPSVHAGILARTSYSADVETLRRIGVEAFELVVVNLYPFGATVAKPDTTPEKALEFIDIGGPTMVRASAKNFPHVCILTNPAGYAAFIEELKSGSIAFETRRRLASEAFSHTAAYDTAISAYFSQWMGESMPK